MNLWNMAFDALPGESELTNVDQRIAHAQVLATLAIGQELSGLNHGETTFSEAIVTAATALAPKAGKR